MKDSSTKIEGNFLVLRVKSNRAATPLTAGAKAAEMEAVPCPGLSGTD